MSFRNKGLVFAMEADDALVNVEINAEGNEVPAAVEADAAELQADAGDVTDLVAATEEAEAGADTLENIAEVMETSADDERGLDPVAAQIAEVAIESICNRLGIRNQKIMPSLESFGSTGSRVTATRVSTENLRETWTRIWTAIKTGFASMWTKIKEFFTKLFVANERLKTAAAKTLEAVKSIGTDAKAAAYENSSVFNAFKDMNSTVIDAGLVEVILKDQTLLVNACVTFVSGSEAALEAADKGLKDAASKEGNAAISEINGAQGKLLNGFVGVAKDAMKKGVPSGLATVIGEAGPDTYVSKPLVNNQILVMKQVVSEGEKTASYLKAEIIPLPDNKSKESSTVRTLKQAEMGVICVEIGKLCDATSVLKAKASALGNVEKKFNAVIDQAIKEVSKVDKEAGKAMKKDDELKAVYTVARNAISGLGKASGVLMTGVPRLSVATGKAALAYVTSSMSQYGKAAVVKTK